MRAIVQNDYGSSDVLSIAEVEKPTPKKNEVLIKVAASSINAGDFFSLKGSPWIVRLSCGFPKPKNFILGWDVAGVVETVGEEVTSFKEGDEVYTACNSAFAEYTCAKEDEIALKPVNLSFEQAAVVPTAALTALQQLRDGCKIKPKQKILINGASGGVGTFCVQIAKALGAEVTAVCSTRNIDIVKSLGADFILDYKKEDFIKSNKRYDCILDNIASRKFSELKQILTPEGKIQPNSGHSGMGYVFKAYFLGMFSRKLGNMSVTKSRSKDLAYLKQLIEAGKIITVIDKTLSMDEAPKGFDYIEREHARGKVGIIISK